VLKVGMREAVLAATAVMVAATVGAQNAPATQEPAPEPVHDMSHMDMPMDMDMSGGGWHFMQDGSLYLMFNHQGSERGDDEFKAPNWWMGMASHRAGPGELTLTGMLSLDPATVGTAGYSEIFQVGETLDGKPLIDRQHPHDFWMQLSAAWRTTVTEKTGITLAGAVSGEPALGPVAFMHRASAAGGLLAPLGHHTFDSTHVSFGVATAGIDHGPIAVEASVFNGREPDQRRWNFDFGPMDSVSGRVWYRPSRAWEFQVSSGRLVEPEQLAHGNVVRTTASGAYTTGDEAHLVAVSAGFGMNAAHESTHHAGFGEVSKAWGRTLGSARLELVQVETELLLTGEVPQTPEGEARRDLVGALTLGAQREFVRWKGFTASLGANGTLYHVPESLSATYGNHPASFQVFLQLRPPVSSMGRMWNMRMAGPAMSGPVPAAHQH
jgi:hypothetical protein